MLGRRATRRELIVGAAGAALGAGGLGAGVGPGALGAESALADTPAPSDAELLGQSLQVERLMVLGYRRVFGSGLLTPAIQRAIAPHLGHELAHVKAVAARLEALGAPATTGPLDLKAAADVMGQYHASDSLTDLHSQNDCLKLLVDLESVAEGIHYTALKDLRSPALQRLSAQIMACEAQHWTVLSGLRNPGQYVKAIPWPFVYGTK
jgi:Ferritin-like domain